MYVFYQLLPKNLVSFWAGKLMHFQFPRPLAGFLIRLFAGVYKINTDEAELRIESYKSIGDFFIRKLKQGARPLGFAKYIHPADSTITARGEISQQIVNSILQAKGRVYKLSDLLQENQVDRWRGGTYVTYYLCPTDYHRVHSPVNGIIKEVRYQPGQLWPVNAWSVANIENLFAVNERVIVEIETEDGPLALVFVGATNVGSIRLTCEPTLRTNHTHHRKAGKITYVQPIPIKKGEELGYFSMGSTVIVIASQGIVELKRLLVVQGDIPVKVGQNP
jgi:phosphatidylserine decarboxylase